MLSILLLLLLLCYADGRTLKPKFANPSSRLATVEVVAERMEARFSCKSVFACTCVRGEVTAGWGNVFSHV